MRNANKPVFDLISIFTVVTTSLNNTFNIGITRNVYNINSWI